MNGPQAGYLADGRLHLNHGPIDLIIQTFGDVAEMEAAYAQATARFQTVLAELVEELAALRKPAVPRAHTPIPDPSPQGGGECSCCLLDHDRRGLVHEGTASESPSPLWGGVRGGGIDIKPAETGGYEFTGAIARRMEAAVGPLAGENFITPMAAVAGSVADEILAAMLAGRALDRAYVNNGGDSALFLAAGQEMRLAIAGTGKGFGDRITIRAEDPVRGIATSGWRGRSFSLGIADAVTVLARSGAEADAAATIIANAVDLPGHPAISREPARALAPDTDLGDRLVTTGVGALSEAEVVEALDRGLVTAETLRRRGLIEAAALFLNGEARVCGMESSETTPSTAFGGPPPPLRRGGTGVAAVSSLDPPPFTGEGDRAKRGGGGGVMYERHNSERKHA